MKTLYTMQEREILSELGHLNTLTVWRNVEGQVSLVDKGPQEPGFDISAVASLALRGFVKEKFEKNEDQSHLVLTPRGKELLQYCL